MGKETGGWLGLVAIHLCGGGLFGKYSRIPDMSSLGLYTCRGGCTHTHGHESVHTHTITHTHTQENTENRYNFSLLKGAQNAGLLPQDRVTELT